MSRPAIALLFAAALAAPAFGSYILTPLSAGANQRTVAHGQSFTLDIVITSDAADTQTSAIFQVRFTRPGLVLTDYQWAPPYGTGDIFDDSKPHHSSLPAPIVPETLEGGLYPPGLTDLEMSNVLIGSTFGTGTIVSLDFNIPSNYAYTGPIFISLNADQIANGFDEVDSTAGQVFRLDVIIPTPAAAIILPAALLRATRRRRHN